MANRRVFGATMMVPWPSGQPVDKFARQCLRENIDDQLEADGYHATDDPEFFERHFSRKSDTQIPLFDCPEEIADVAVYFLEVTAEPNG